MRTHWQKLSVSGILCTWKRVECEKMKNWENKVHLKRNMMRIVLHANVQRMCAMLSAWTSVSNAHWMNITKCARKKQERTRHELIANDYSFKLMNPRCECQDKHKTDFAKKKKDFVLTSTRSNFGVQTELLTTNRISNSSMNATTNKLNGINWFTSWIELFSVLFLPKNSMCWTFSGNEFCTLSKW